jgi:GT2 family glycosyltransferase
MVSSYHEEIVEARQMIAELAVEKNAKYLLFIDDDVHAPPEAVLKLMYILEQDKDAMIASGIYFQKTEPTQPIMFQKKGEGPSWNWRKGELIECDIVGLGFALIKVEVFSKLQKPWYALGTDFKEGERYSYDDSSYFCDKVKEAGFKIIADGGILCDHYDMDTKKVYRIPEDSYPNRNPVPLGVEVEQ